MKKAGKRVNRIHATAHHEAGHAVATFRLHLKFRKVTIIPVAGESLGHMLAPFPRWFVRAVREGTDTARALLYAEQQIVANLAGQLAEARYRGRHPRGGFESDNVNVGKIMFGLRESSTKAMDAYIRYCWCEAEHVVDIWWDEIEAVAAALLERKTLKYLDVLDVISHLPRASRAVPKTARK